MATLAALTKSLQKHIDIGNRILALHDPGLPPDIRAELAKATELSHAVLAGTAVQDDFLTVPQIAEELKVNPETVRRWIRTGELAAQPLSTHLHPRHRILRSGLNAFVQKRGGGEPD